MAYKRSRADYEADLQAQQSPYVTYGTPLPPLDPSVRDDGSYVPIWKQEVTDERGRKRLHGAFTGGFSAGYFNTVGSKEGWTPASFVSSRSNRNKDAASQQKPEDFMDEEDMAQQEEDRKIATRDSFAGLGSTAADVGARATVMDLLHPAGDTVGTKLLRKMGWRDGQGIGPKVRRKARQDVDDGPLDNDEKDEETHLFAPDDSPMIAFVRKTDHKGLGFAGQDKLQALVSRKDDASDEDEPATLIGKSSQAPKKKALGARGGFGVGILNDDGSGEDEDPYSMGPRLSYGRVVGGKDAKKKKKKGVEKASSNANPLIGHRPVLISKRNALKSAFRKCHDGRLPLPGFVLALIDASTGPLQEAKYPPPEIPEGWHSEKTPRHATSSAAGDTRLSTTELAKSSTHNPTTRAALLGEEKLPGKSVFSFLTPEARDRLANLTSNTSLPSAGSEAVPAAAAAAASTAQHNPSDNPADLIPPLSPRTASAALGRGTSGFVPYSEDPAKQARYRAYLSYQANLPSATAPSPPTNCVQKAVDEWAQELGEFAQAATIFKPMTGGMASRFTSATGTSASTDAPGDKAASDAVATLKKKDPAVEAALAGMFGPLTRSQCQFYPTRLLCKRFGVPAPPWVAGDADDATRRGKADASGALAPSGTDAQSAKFASAGFQVGADAGVKTGELLTAGYTPTSSSRKDVSLLGDKRLAEIAKEAGYEVREVQEDKEEPVKIEPGHNEVLDQERPGEELFRAVFGSDSEDE